MKTSVETLDPVKIKLTVEVEPKRVKQAFDKAARELAKQVSIPGFRPGKAPRRLIEQRFGAGVIAQQAMEDAVSDYYLEAVRAEDVVPVGRPEVDVETFTEADGCVFTATVEVRPEVDLPDHTGLAVPFPTWDVDDAAIDGQLEQLREHFAEVEVVERPAATGDLTSIDLAVEIDGVELEQARVEDALYEVGSGGVTPRLDEEIVGKVSGDELTYEDTLPENYPEHGGEEATFRVTVKDVREKQLPALDDEFAMTASEFDSLQDLRADLRGGLLRRSILQAQHNLRGAVVERYLELVAVPLPPSMVEADAHDRIHQMQQQAERFGATLEQLLEMDDTTVEEFEAKAHEQAEQAVKAQIVLDRLAAQLEVTVEAADVDREILRHAQLNGIPPQEIARIVQQQGSLPMLLGDILRRKAIDAIVTAAEVDGAPADEILGQVGLERVDGVIVERPTEDTDDDPVDPPAATDVVEPAADADTEAADTDTEAADADVNEPEAGDDAEADADVDEPEAGDDAEA